jgi:phospholipid/cholesterol/gamma-HCH transport system substrate-binding protein
VNRRSRLIATMVKLAVFAVVSVLATVLTVNTLDPPLPGQTHRYSAVFTDATGVLPGSDVRIAGVRVGKVTGVAPADAPDGRAAARVDFAISADQVVPADARVAVRYADLLGARYLSVLPGESGPGGAPLADGATIPLPRTEPALDLTEMLGGFKPLFDLLEPDEVNQFAAEIIAVFQGEAGTVHSLLARTVKVTQNLAAKDDVISSVLNNLTAVVDFTVAHREDFTELLNGLATLTHGVAEDRQQIIDALDATSGLASSVAQLVETLAPDLEAALGPLAGTGQTLIANQQAFTQVLAQTPAFLDTTTRIVDYGSWANLYICNLSINVVGGQPVDFSAGPHSEVCR